MAAHCPTAPRALLNYMGSCFVAHFAFAIDLSESLFAKKCEYFEFYIIYILILLPGLKIYTMNFSLSLSLFIVNRMSEFRTRESSSEFPVIVVIGKKSPQKILLHYRQSLKWYKNLHFNLLNHFIGIHYCIFLNHFILSPYLSRNIVSTKLSKWKFYFLAMLHLNLQFALL